jgi:hypothetical protein
MNQGSNTARKITSTTRANGGQAITMKANATHASTFRTRDIHVRFRNVGATTTNRSRAAPRHGDSPDAKYKATWLIGAIVSGLYGWTGESLL